jgi:hypothetical protein
MKTVPGIAVALADSFLAHDAVAIARWPDQAPHQIADLG